MDIIITIIKSVAVIGIIIVTGLLFLGIGELTISLIKKVPINNFITQGIALFTGLMKIIHMIACKMGFHKWREWQNISADSCIQIQECRHCNKRSINTRTMHHYKEWEYDTPKSCLQVRKCYCGEKEERTSIEKHNWQRWQEEKGTSNYLRQCSHCERQEKGTVISICSVCNGEGYIFSACDECIKHPSRRNNSPGQLWWEADPCSNCRPEEQCPQCNGMGKIIQVFEVEGKS